MSCSKTLHNVSKIESENLEFTNTLEKSNSLTRKQNAYLYNFFCLGEWKHVMIDEKLPIKLNLKLSGKYERRGKAFAAEDIEEFWALLLEKAFAKLVGGYMKLEGGTPACALTFLS